MTEDTNQVVYHVAGYIAKKAAKSCNDCCKRQLLYEGPSNSNGHIAMLSRGGQRMHSKNLSECVEQGFAVLHNISKAMQDSNLPSRHAGQLIFKTYLNFKIVCCESHNSQLFNMIICTIVNVFFNNKRKIGTDSVVCDEVAAFKKCKRENRNS